MALVQVDCDPPGIINVKVVDANASGAGYIALTFFSVRLEPCF